jgi:hypothetical protein
MAVWSTTAISGIRKNFGRFDAEFYQPEFLETDRILSHLQGVTLGRIAAKIDVGHVGPMVRHYRENGVLMLQTQNVKEFFLDLDHTIRVTEAFHSQLRKSQIKKGDILIARSGSFGSAAIYLEDKVINSADIIIVEIDDPEVEPLYAVAFMNTKHGSAQLVRFASGGVQGHVNLRILEHFRLPLFEDKYQKQIKDQVRAAYDAKATSEQSYEEAEKLLDLELGLDKLQPKKLVSYTTQASEVAGSRRTDAEYYDPTARQIVHKITSLGHTKLRESFHVGSGFPWASTKFLPDNTGEPVVRIRNIKPSHIDPAELTSILPAYANSIGFPKAKRGDIVVGMDGIKYFYASLLEGACYVNQRVTHLSPNQETNVSPEYAVFIINSRVGQAQLMRDMTVATTVGHITNRDVAKLVLPTISQKFHDTITSLVRQSIDAKEESKRLLAQAKARVEQLIEEAVAK